MSQVSVSAAAKLVGKDRKTLYRLIKEGKLSATTGHNGARQIETSELIRVFGVIGEGCDTVDSGETVAMPQPETPGDTVRLAVLEAENRHLRERLAEKDQHIEDMRNAVRLLEFKRKKSWWKPWS